MTGCGENSNNNSLKGSKVTITDINGNSTELTMDEFKSKVEGNVTSFNNKYLTNPEVEDDFEDKLKLKPLVSDDEVYSKIIMNQQDILTNDEKKSNVYKNYVYIKNKLKSLFFSYSIEDLLEALDKFYFVIIPLGGQDKPQEIFETINSAGAELSKADLIRNFILMNIESNLQDTLYSQYWQPMEDLFAKNGKMENFFRMFLANQNYVLDNMEDIYNVFQEWFLTQKNECGKDTEEILKLIVKYANYYYNLFISNTVPLESPIKESLIEFKKSTIEPTAPILMEIYRLYDTKDPNGNRLVDADSFAHIIDLFNTYNIRRNITDYPNTRNLTKIFMDIVADISGKQGNNVYDSIVSILKNNSSDDQTFETRLRGPVYADNPDATRFLLCYYEDKFKTNEIHTNLWSRDRSNKYVWTIEHIFPEGDNIPQDWINMIADGNKELAYEYLNNYVHTLGNLTITGYNQNLSNFSFEKKKERTNSDGKYIGYRNRLELNKDVVNQDSWKIENIKSRTDYLVKSYLEDFKL